MSRLLFRYLCVFLLLCAQQGALVHAAWHVGDMRDAVTHPAHEPHSAPESPQPGDPSSLCVFDWAFGQLFGGLLGVKAPAPGASVPVLPGVGTPTPSHSIAPPHAAARGPPATL